MRRQALIASWLLLFILALQPAPRARAQDTNVFFHETFNTLANWAPFYYPKIKKHSVYTIVDDGGHQCLKAESHASASALVYRKTFNVYEYRNVKWRWKVDRVYKKGKTCSKAGDDYPIRVYVLFEYDPDKAGFFERLKFNLAKSIYGYYPPQSSLTYVWANKEQPETIVTSPYTKRAKMVLLQMGPKNVGTWQDEEIDILRDYQKAFGVPPPDRARIAIMNDSDNTGESSVSYIDSLEVFRKTP
jgi:hypothetical protein